MLLEDFRQRIEKIASGVMEMQAETTFKNRVQLAFGRLFGAVENVTTCPGMSVNAGFWSVSEKPIDRDHDEVRRGGSSGSDSEPCAAHYKKFVKLERRGRRKRREENDSYTGEDFMSGGGILSEDEEESLEEKEEDRQALASRSDTISVQEALLPGNVEDGGIDDEDEETRQIRLMVGLDPTLDYEEEEDEYDKVAIGREGKGERIYMKEFNESAFSCLVSSPEMGAFKRDARANHSAAASRLEEDAQQAALFGNNPSRQFHEDRDIGISEDNDRKVLTKDNSSEDRVKSQGDTEDGELEKPDPGVGIRTILKSTREHSRGTDTKVQKVRFCEDDIKDVQNVVEDIEESRMSVAFTGRSSLVPDHVRNPSKYTYYSLDWSDNEDSDQSNIAAFHATRTLTKQLEWTSQMGMHESIELPKSITFTPRGGGASSKDRTHEQSRRESESQQAQPLVSFYLGTGLPDNCFTGFGTDNVSNVISGESSGKRSRVFRRHTREESPEGVIEEINQT